VSIINESEDVFMPLTRKTMCDIKTKILKTCKEEDINEK